MALTDDAAREVEALHDFIEDWFAGRVADDAFDRMGETLAPEFEIVTPEGERLDREELLDGMREGHGSQATSVPPFEIRVDDVTGRVIEEEICVVTYDERQRSDGEESVRTSTAVFCRDDDAPNGVAWLHLHETWVEPQT